MMTTQELLELCKGQPVFLPREFVESKLGEPLFHSIKRIGAYAKYVADCGNRIELRVNYHNQHGEYDGANILITVEELKKYFKQPTSYEAWTTKGKIL